MNEVGEGVSVCEQCGRASSDRRTDASARFDFCCQVCEDIYRAQHKPPEEE